ARVGGSAVIAERFRVDGCVEIVAEPVRVENRGSGERRHNLLARDERPAPQRDQPADGCAVPGDRERLAALNAAHDLARVVAQFALRDLPRVFAHAAILSRYVLRSATRDVAAVRAAGRFAVE